MLVLVALWIAVHLLCGCWRDRRIALSRDESRHHETNRATNNPMHPRRFTDACASAIAEQIQPFDTGEQCAYALDMEPDAWSWCAFAGEAWENKRLRDWQDKLWWLCEIDFPPDAP